MTAIRRQINLTVSDNHHTILDLPYSRLDIVQRQVADLGLETVEIHIRCRFDFDAATD